MQLEKKIINYLIYKNTLNRILKKGKKRKGGKKDN